MGVGWAVGVVGRGLAGARVAARSGEPWPRWLHVGDDIARYALFWVGGQGGNELRGGEGGASAVRNSGSGTQLLAARVST
jgi:hypothetical protein